MQRSPSVFVSYTWDEAEYRNWVVELVESMREYGVKVSMDVLQTYLGILSWQDVILKHFDTKDYVVFVLTSEYAERVNALEKGVDPRKSFLRQSIQENLEKVIPLVRCKGRVSKAIPCCFRGVRYIDFSHPHSFEKKSQDLLHRIFTGDSATKLRLGKTPAFSPRRIVTSDRVFIDDMDDLILELVEVLDHERIEFMIRSLEEIRDGMLQLLARTKEKNANFDFDCDDVTDSKTVYRLYVNGVQKCAAMLWYGTVRAVIM